MALHTPNIRAIRLFVPFVIPYADFIPSALLATLTVTNSRVWVNDTNFNRLFSGKP